MAIQSVKRDYTLHRRVVLLILLDLLAVNFSALAALLLRFEFSINDLAESGFAQIYLKTAPLYSVLSILCLRCCTSTGACGRTPASTSCAIFSLPRSARRCWSS